jgi:hypothetical protein
MTPIARARRYGIHTEAAGATVHDISQLFNKSRPTRQNLSPLAKQISIGSHALHVTYMHLNIKAHYDRYHHH